MNPLTRRAYNRKWQAERREKLKAEGRCLWCGRAQAKPSKRSPTGYGTLCEACSRKGAVRTKKRMTRIRPVFRVLHICLACLKRKAVPGKTKCAVCQEYEIEAQIRRRAS
jgi:formylmethanofuran dehydrogenase subunit E